MDWFVKAFLKASLSWFAFVYNIWRTIDGTVARAAVRTVELPPTVSVLRRMTSR